jgi:hypothetical protein
LGRQKKEGPDLRGSLKIVAAAIAGLIIGAGAGGVIGFRLASGIWARMSHSSSAATGDQAYNVLLLLDQGKNVELRDYLEAEIDSTLLSLHAMQAAGSLSSDEPLARVAERLSEYRSEHPRHPRPAGLEGSQ